MSAYADSDTASIASTAAKLKDPIKRAWCQTQWTNLSLQGTSLGLPIDYFDPSTMLLDKVTNKQLWKLLNRLYDSLGPERAPFATPKMHEAGRVDWHSYIEDSRGVIAEIVD